MKIRRSLFVGWIMTMALCPSLSEASAKNAYGILAFDEEDVFKINSLVSFPVEGGVTSFESVYPFGTTSTAGAYADGTYYVCMSKNTGAGEVPDSFVAYDFASGKTTTLGTISGLTNIVNDMAYDNTGRMMYAVSRLDNVKSVLYTVDLANASFEKVVDLDRRFFTLACTYSGQLYGVSFDGDFCSIDKNTGEVGVVGATGFHPTAFQTMEFDHGDKTLYWAASVLTVSDNVEVEESFMATIDTKTGKATRLGDMGTNAQIAGLYIPFVASADNTPAAVAELSVVPDASGAAKAVLSWKNPTETFGGDPLSALTKIEVYRNDALITTIENPQPGNAESFTDELSEVKGGQVTYKVVASNENGAGVPTEYSCYVGVDVPGVPTGVQATKTSYDAVALSWKAPVAGMNGGWFDKATLHYKVVRMPDEKVVADNLMTTETKDEGILPVATYYYQVYAVNDDGESVAATTPSMVLGPLNTIPYHCDFASAEEAATWTVVDGNGDGVKWERPAYAPNSNLTYKGSYSSQADDWMISHAFKMEKGKTYKVDFTVFSASQNDFRFFLLENADPGQQVQALEDYPAVQSYTPAEKSFTFVADRDGVFNIGLQLYSAPNTISTWIYITGVNMDMVTSVNLAATSVTGNSRPKVGVSSAYQVSVMNKGAEAQSNFTVRLKDAETGEVLASKDVAASIAANETQSVELFWTPQTTVVKSVVGEVVCVGDELESDNVSASFPVDVQPEGSADYVSIGSNSEGESVDHPFAFWQTNGAVMNIYGQSEIDKSSGVIEKLLYTYTCKWNGATGVPVKVYMANTDRSETTAGWIGRDQMELVYDGTIDLQGATTAELELPLDRYFEYMGNNLAILTVHSFANYSSVSGINFPYYTSPMEGNKALIWTGGSATFDFSQTGEQGNANSSVTLLMQAEGCAIYGKVLDGTTAVANAELELPERKMKATTDANGEFRFSHVPNGTYSLKVVADGHDEKTIEGILVDGADKEVDVNFSNASVEGLSIDAVRVYPNPATTVVNIDGEFTQVELLDLSGRCVARFSGNSHAIDVSGLEKSVYLMVITNDKTHERTIEKLTVK